MGTMRTWRVVNDNVEVLISGTWGMQLIPQQFARDIYDEKDWNNVENKDVQLLKNGSETPGYEQAWNNVLQAIKCNHREYPNWTLRQNEKNLYIVASEEDWQEYLKNDDIE